MTQKKLEIKKGTIITVAIVLSIVLYLAGVFSGLYANKVIEMKTEQDLKNLKYETKKDIEFLKAETKEDVELMKIYVESLERNLKNTQLDQIFIDTLDDDIKCDFSTITTNSLLDQLGFYWENLPFRIEAYEKNNVLSEEYLKLKEQYTQLSIRAWVIANKNYHSCKSGFIPLLYFYTKNCSNCISQGEELDLLQSNNTELKQKIVVFTVDMDSEEITIKNLKEFYNITSTPALIVNNKVLQGRLFSKQEILDELA